MADPSQYLVNPDTQEVVEVPPEWVERAKQREYRPATEQQIRDFQAKDYAAQHPILSTAKTAALGAASLFGPLTATTFADVALGLSASGAEKQAREQETARLLTASMLGKPVAAPTPREEYARKTAEVLERAKGYVEPLTPAGALVATGIMTPESIKAAREEAGLTGEILGMAGAVVGPAALSRLTLSGLAKREAAQVIEERAAEAAARAARLTEAGAPEAAIAIKESEKAAVDMAKAIDAATSRRALLAKVPGGEKIARGLDRALKLPEEQSALNLVSESVGRPVAQAAEASTRSLIESAPYLSQAPQVVKDIVAKSIASGAGSAADLALLNLGQVSQESVLGDHKITSERVLAAMEHGAIDGFLFGAAVGAVPPVLVGAVDASSAALRALDRTFNRYYPKIAARLTGASVESVEALRRARGETANLGELIEQDLAARQPLPPEPAPFVPGVAPAPFEPQMPAMVGVEGVGMVPATARGVGIGPMAAPELVPPPIKPQPLEVTKLPADQVERVAQGFFGDLKQVDETGNALMYELNKTYRPTEQIELFKTWREQQGRRILAEMKAELGGRPATPADAERFTRRVAELDDMAYDEGMRLASYIKGAAQGLAQRFPKEIPSSTIRQMNKLASKLEKASARGKSVADLYESINSVKGQLFEMAPEVSGQIYIPEVDRAIRSTVRRAGGELIQSTQRADLWGDNAARQAAVNAMRTRFTLAQSNLKRFWGRKEDVGLDASRRAFSSSRVSSFVEDPVSVRNADALDAYNEYRSALSDLQRETRESAKYYQGETGLGALDKSIGGLAKSYTEVENNALRKMDIEFAVEQGKKADAEYKRLKAEVDAENTRRKNSADALQAKVNELEGERKIKAQADLERLKAENDLARDQAKARLDEFKARQKAMQQEADAKRSAWEEQLKQRRMNVDEQINLLTKGKKMDDTTLLLVVYEALKNPVFAVTGLMAKSPVATYKVLSKLEAAAKATESRTRAVIDYLATGEGKYRTALGLVLQPKTEKQERELFNERVKKLDALTNDVGELSSHLDRSVANVDQHAPNIADHSKSVTATAISALAGAIPRPPPNTPPYDLAAWQPRADQIREFNRRYEAISQPLNVISLAAQNAATRDQIELIDMVYPTLMNDIRTRLVDKLKQDQDISAPRRRALANLMNLNIDSTMKLGIGAQQIYNSGMAAARTPQQMPVSRAKGLGLAGRANRETAEFRAAQQGIGAWNKTNK